MKPLYCLLLFLCVFFSIGLKAQQDHFVYIQTENRQAFYVRIDKTLYSSTASGYVIVPKLADGTHSATFGFPNQQAPEQKFTFVISNKDLGYLLKDFGDKGWGLFNLQTLSVAMADNNDNTDVANTTTRKTDTKTDAFSSMLAAAVNDPSIKHTETIDEEKQPEAQKTVNADSSNLLTIPATPSAKKIISKSLVTKILSNTTSSGTEAIYLDTQNGKTDTIKIFIPAEPSDVIADTQKTIQQEEVKTEPVKPEQPKTEKFMNMDSSNQNVHIDTITKTDTTKIVAATKTVDTVISNASIVQSQPIVAANPVNSCKNIASNEDFLKLRKKMAGETKDDDMLVTARKVFKTKCFTTEQVKNLSTLFLSDAGKYGFFEMGYQFVSDAQNYSSLESQLSDAYYINRFKAMIQH